RPIVAKASPHSWPSARPISPGADPRHSFRRITMIADATPAPYAALALQVTCPAVNKLTSREEVEQSMLATIARLEQQIRASRAFIGPQVRLVVLPEYFLTSFPMGESIESWRDRAAVEIGGRIYE